MGAGDLLWLIPVLPFARRRRERRSWCAIARGRWSPRSASARPDCRSLVALVCLWQFVSARSASVRAGALRLDGRAAADRRRLPASTPLSAVMLFVVTFVGFWIHVYSVGYMGHEEGYRRYFAYLNLFMGAMLLLVLGNNYLVAVRRLGGRRPLLVPADRLLLRAGVPAVRRQEGVHRQPDRRLRLPARHVRGLVELRHAPLRSR